MEHFCGVYQSLYDYHSSNNQNQQIQPTSSIEFTSVKLDWEKLMKQNERKSSIPVNQSRRGRKRYRS